MARTVVVAGMQSACSGAPVKKRTGTATATWDNAGNMLGHVFSKHKTRISDPHPAASRTAAIGTNLYLCPREKT